MNRIVFTALFLLGLCAGSALAQYPAGCSKEATPSGFTGCELAQLHIFKANVADAVTPEAKQIAVLRVHYFIEGCEHLHSLVYEDASKQKTADAKKKFQEQWPDGRLVPKGTR